VESYRKVTGPAQRTHWLAIGVAGYGCPLRSSITSLAALGLTGPAASRRPIIMVSQSIGGSGRRRCSA
jgi:hypothetical protein